MLGCARVLPATRSSTSWELSQAASLTRIPLQARECPLRSDIADERRREAGRPSLSYWTERLVELFGRSPEEIGRAPDLQFV